MIIPVILAGGSGTRLWPLSNKKFPKELLKLHGNKTLLQSTLSQIKFIRNAQKPLIVADVKHKNIIAKQLNAIKTKATLLLETESRDTATSVALAAKYALTLHENALLLILPIDHFISNTRQFGKMIASASKTAFAEKWVIFGVKPSFPATDYGYIKKGKKIQKSDGFYVDRFAEKPNLKTATRYFNSKNYYVNSGISLLKASVFLNELSQHSPRIYSYIEKTENIIEPKRKAVFLNSHLMKKYQPISVDKAVLEKSKICAVFSFKGNWHDLGNWNSLYTISKKDSQKNVKTKKVFSFNTKNSYLYSNDRILTTLNISDLLVVVTKEAVLVAKRDQNLNIKKMVRSLPLRKK